VQKVFRVNASPIFEQDKLSGCLAVIHDITELRKLEKVRTDFVANVSHELRTPLTSIKGFVETLLEGALEDKENSRQFLKIIQGHSERLNNLINDLLDLSQVESNKIELKLARVRLKELTDKVIAGVKSQLKKKGLDVQNRISPGTEASVDRDRLEQVITNLIDNAIKFNKENGSIKISCEELPGQIKVTVEDSGQGIPEKDLPRIFERFYRVDKARSRELGGTGLGLSIVKHIVELHGGSVGVESTEGLGSKFFFILPTFNPSLKLI
jgi:two-component system phosphate regulon sensor histidine kinase PhoR